MVTVFIPYNLRRFTADATQVEVEAATLGELVEKLESKFAGIAAELLEGDRIRPGLALICDGAPARFGLKEKLQQGGEVHIVAAIAGGQDYPQATIEQSVAKILENLGYYYGKIDENGVATTPKRVARMYEEILCGYRQNVGDVIGEALFDVRYDEMVVVRNIEFYSLCEHHLLPFYGRAHIGYLPKAKVVGLSKIPRIVEVYARRLQVQERLTEQIAQSLHKTLDANATGVVIEATHLCVAMRGVGKANALMTTSALRGNFKTNADTRDEFIKHIRD